MPPAPATIGRERKIIIDKYTGRRAVAARLEEYGVVVGPEDLERIVEEIKLGADSERLQVGKHTQKIRAEGRLR